MSPLGGDDFDQWLGQHLRRQASVHSGPSPMPAQAQYNVAPIAPLNGALHVPLLAKVATLATTKAVIALSAGVLAAGAAGAGEAVISGSGNPGDWGQQVFQQLQKCNRALAPGSPAIGDCVSSFASGHGKKVSSDHRATPTLIHAEDHAAGPVHGKVQPTSGAKVQPTPGAKLKPTPGARVQPTLGGDVNPALRNYGRKSTESQ